VIQSGFLQVRESWQKSGNLCGQGKVKVKYYFLKVRENDLGSCRLHGFFVSLHNKKQANLRLPLNIQKIEVFQLQEGGYASLTFHLGPLSFAYCCINTVSLLYDIVYHF